MTIPDSLTTIGESAFTTNALTSVFIPNAVTSIGGNAFATNALLTVAIGSSVGSIGNYAFGSYNALENVCYKGSYLNEFVSAFGNYDVNNIVGDSDLLFMTARSLTDR